MSEIENSLNALEEQTLFSAMTKEETNSFDQQQQYQEQQNMDNYSGETGETSSNSTPAELMEVPQSPTQLSSIESTISSPSTLEHNCNSSDSSNSSNSSTISSFSSTSQLDYDTPFNPISFLNTMHQKLKTSEAPVYTFSHDSVTGHFYCQVNFCGQTYENNNARPKKQQAKEEAASTAMKDLSLRMPEITDVIRQELIRARSLVSQKNKHGNNNKNHNQTLNYHKSYQPPELISKSLQWYNRQVAQAKSNGQEKRPCVLLLEFCQMHRIGHPTYRIRDDGRGYYYFDCTVFNRTFTGELAFWRKGDAKDHVSSIAFACLYREFFDKEQHEIQQSYGGIYGISPPLPPHPSNVAFSPIYPNVADANNYYSSYQ